MGRIKQNIDKNVVNDFGKEWKKFEQSNVPINELKIIFNNYFSLFPWNLLPDNAKDFDLECGSGRWAYFCTLKVGKLHYLDPSSEALEVAKNTLSHYDNVEFHIKGAHVIPFEDNSMDFSYSLGVLHHLPDTQLGINNCVSKLKKNAPFLIYLYYAFDPRTGWFKEIWKISNYFRKLISTSPFFIKNIICQLIALIIYFPISHFSKVLEKLGISFDNFPLTFYRDKSFYTLKTDALDRFGTRLEQRFTKAQINRMMLNAGLKGISFKNDMPYWCAIGYKE